MNLNDINNVFKASFWHNRESDGDSIWVLTDLRLDVLHVIELRLKDVWAPEKSTAQGKLVKKAVEDWLDPLPYLVIKTYKTKTDRDIRTFTRYVADVWLPDGVYFNEAITTWMANNGITDHGTGS